MKYLSNILLILVFAGCKQQVYYAEQVSNPEYRENTMFRLAEDIALPRFDSLRTKFQLDTALKNETDELKRILLLRNWIRNHIPNDDNKQYYSGNGYPDKIIDAGLRGEGFHCAHYMAVQNGIMNEYGYVTRCIGSGPGVAGAPDQHHGINEIWLNSYHKWFLSDAKYDHHFEKNGVPLSALEVRAEYIKNKAADINMVKGPNRTITEIDPVVHRTKESFAKTYTWIEWNVYNDKLSYWPASRKDLLLMYRDDYTRNNTWLWDGHPHWAYNTEFVVYTDSASAVEWTPNIIRSKVLVNGNTADILLTSNTPNFKEYEMKDAGSGEWKLCDSILALPLSKDRYELAFRSVNKAGVYGPVNTVIIASK